MLGFEVVLIILAVAVATVVATLGSNSSSSSSAHSSTDISIDTLDATVVNVSADRRRKGETLWRPFQPTSCH
jgi:hypothetical protein